MEIDSGAVELVNGKSIRLVSTEKKMFWWTNNHIPAAEIFCVDSRSPLIFFRLSLLFSWLEIISRFGACVITLGLAAIALNCEPGNGSRYGGGGGLVAATAAAVTDISNGISTLLPLIPLLLLTQPMMPFVWFDSPNGLILLPPFPVVGSWLWWYSDDRRMRRSRRHLVVGNSLFIDNRVSAEKRKEKRRKIRIVFNQCL